MALAGLGNNIVFGEKRSLEPSGALSVSLQASKAEWAGLHTDLEITPPKL